MDLKAGDLRLRDAQTGDRSVALSPAASKVLAALPRKQDNPWVIMGPGEARHLRNLNAPGLWYGAVGVGGRTHPRLPKHLCKL